MGQGGQNRNSSFRPSLESLSTPIAAPNWGGEREGRTMTAGANTAAKRRLADSLNSVVTSARGAALSTWRSAINRQTTKRSLSHQPSNISFIRRDVNNPCTVSEARGPGYKVRPLKYGGRGRSSLMFGDFSVNSFVAYEYHGMVYIIDIDLAKEVQSN